jgi:hypothetical protein
VTCCIILSKAVKVVSTQSCLPLNFGSRDPQQCESAKPECPGNFSITSFTSLSSVFVNEHIPVVLKVVCFTCTISVNQA